MHPRHKEWPKLRLEFAEDKYPNGDERRGVVYSSLRSLSPMFWSSRAYNNRYRQIILEVSKDEDCFAPDLNGFFFETSCTTSAFARLRSSFSNLIFLDAIVSRLS